MKGDGYWFWVMVLGDDSGLWVLVLVLVRVRVRAVDAHLVEVGKVVGAQLRDEFVKVGALDRKTEG